MRFLHFDPLSRASTDHLIDVTRDILSTFEALHPLLHQVLVVL